MLAKLRGPLADGAALPALLAAFAVGAIVLAIGGIDPITGYSALINGVFEETNLPYVVAALAPVLGMAVSFAIPFRMQEFNLGGDGQLVIGGITGAGVALALPDWGLLTFALAALAAALAGGLLAAISAPLLLRGRVPVIISTLLLGFPAVSLASYLARYPLADEGSGTPQTERLPVDMRLPSLGDWSPYVNTGLIVILLVFVAYWVVDARTTTGLDLRVVGANPRFGRYAGVNVPSLLTLSLAASGAIAGLVGALLVAAPPYRFIDGALTVPGYTFTGVTVAMLSRGRPAALFAAALLFTALQVGGTGMERDVGVPRQLTAIIQASVVITFVVIVAARSRRARAKAGLR
ncbi:hypothetical protein [Actinoplanes sp. NPDC051851]|uniref:ABC transporter permease n=1 Tax=Actinoplanes sp. NPDC051851 TaxID=3154753 RepID=UPI003442E726